MGRRGPRPKPRELKLIQGTHRPDREAPNVPTPEVQAPSCPSFLSAEAKREWRRIVPELERLGMLCELDRAALAAYCQSWATWVGAERAITRKGKTFKTPNGYIQQRPEVAMAKSALGEMRRFLAEFGMSPAARTRVSAEKAREETPKRGSSNVREFLRRHG